MGFWIFMLINNLFVPLVMIGFGILFRKHPPKQIHSLYGYRTKMSRLNLDTWDYAHRYFGRLWLRLGCILLPVTVFAMLLLIVKSDDTVGILGAVVLTGQCIVLILPIVATEWKLRQVFDLDGNRIR